MSGEIRSDPNTIRRVMGWDGNGRRPVDGFDVIADQMVRDLADQALHEFAVRCIRKGYELRDGVGA